MVQVVLSGGRPIPALGANLCLDSRLDPDRLLKRPDVQPKLVVSPRGLHHLRVRIQATDEV